MSQAINTLAEFATARQVLMATGMHRIAAGAALMNLSVDAVKALAELDPQSKDLRDLLKATLEKFQEQLEEKHIEEVQFQQLRSIARDRIFNSLPLCPVAVDDVLKQMTPEQITELGNLAAEEVPAYVELLLGAIEPVQEKPASPPAE